MATQPHRRENLLAQATAFERRLLLELTCPADWSSSAGHPRLLLDWCREWIDQASWELFLGWRRGGGWSVYFDQQPVMQFTADDQLRRLYAGNQRYAAHAGQLQGLRREATGGQVQLVPALLSAADQAEFCRTCQVLLASTVGMLQNGHFAILGQVPATEACLVPAATAALARVAAQLRIAATPHA